MPNSLALNAFGILDLYFRLKENPEIDIVPRTSIFGAKVATGYIRAKGIIKFINEIGKLINNDPQVMEKIKVVFVQNYRVSYGERYFLQQIFLSKFLQHVKKLQVLEI